SMHGQTDCVSADAAPTATYTLSLHDALPIYRRLPRQGLRPLSLRGGRRQEQGQQEYKETHRLDPQQDRPLPYGRFRVWASCSKRSEEHTSELQSRSDLVCRLLLEKKKPVFHN